MSKYYCHKTFSSGLTCSCRTIDGMCSGGKFVACTHKSKTPKFSLPMPATKSSKRKSTDCTWCAHRDVCSLKKKFNEMKKNNYPLVCECENYKSYNPLLEV